MWEIFSGLLKSLLFGLIIGLVGCYKGLNAGSNSASLGKAVTSAVVLSITLIVVCDAMASQTTIKVIESTTAEVTAFPKDAELLPAFNPL